MLNFCTYFEKLFFSIFARWMQKCKHTKLFHQFSMNLMYEKVGKNIWALPHSHSTLEMKKIPMIFV